MCLDALTGDGAKFRLGRDDLPHPDDARLLGKAAQQRHRHIGFNVVLAHVAGVAAVVQQELHHVQDVGRQVNGNGHRPAISDGGLFGAFPLRGTALFVGFGQTAQVGTQVGVRQRLLSWRRRDVIVASGGNPRNGGHHEDYQRGQD